MHTVPIYQLKNELSRFIDLVAAGEEVAITRRGQEVARLVPSTRTPGTDRATEIRGRRATFATIPVFDEHEVRTAGRKW